jgi:hypothetical protein
MQVAKALAAGLSLLALVGVSVQAADLVRLDWGDFTVESDSPSKPKSWEAKAGADTLSLAMTFDTLTAKADQGVAEGSAGMSGHFTVLQPQSVSLSNLRIELRGRIVKTAGSVARIDVVIGDAQRSVEWLESEEVADAFVRTIDAPVAGGQLPNPFTVSAILTAKQVSGKGAAIVTLEALDVDAGSSKLAVHTQ